MGIWNKKIEIMSYAQYELFEGCTFLDLVHDIPSTKLYTLLGKPSRGVAKTSESCWIKSSQPERPIKKVTYIYASGENELENRRRESARAKYADERKRELRKGSFIFQASISSCDLRGLRK